MIERKRRGITTPNCMRRLLTFIILVALTACVAERPIPSSSILLSVDAQEWREWTAKGKLGLQIGKKAHQLNFSWQNRGATYRIHLYGPFGKGVVLSGDPSGIKMERGGGEAPSFAATPEKLLLSEMGWTIPLSNLQYWIRGYPSPYGPSSGRQDNQSTLTTLYQDGWSIHYREYKRYKRYRMPKKVELHRGDIKITAVIKDWQWRTL